MRTKHVPGAVSGVALVLALTVACGSTAPDTAEPTKQDGASASSPASERPSNEKDERITPGGIAAIVLDHLGGDAVRQFVTYEPEPGSVSVMIRMQEGTPHNFAVQVYAPQHARQFGKAGMCPPKHQLGNDSQCRTLDNGTTVMTSETSEGFSDDNADGMVITGTAISQKDGAGMAMYESYDDAPAVSVKDIEEILIDPRLTWLTEPAVNTAGEGVELKELTG